ncbi:MAG: ROK family protein [Phycisphaerae bacterium]
MFDVPLTLVENFPRITEPARHPMAELYIGIDLGGTNIKSGLVQADGTLVKTVSVPTGKGPDAVIANMIASAEMVLRETGHKKSEIAGVGITSPGVLDTSKGVVIKAGNLEGFVQLPLCARVSQGLGLPAILANDANAAAFGEYFAGIGRTQGIQDLVLFTLGTGVGGGIICQGELIRGAHDGAAELGHMVIQPGGIPCTCGQSGCLERYASANACGDRAVTLLQTSKALSSLREVLAKTGTLTAADVTLHAEKYQDPLAEQIWDETCRFLAMGCLISMYHTDPELVVLGGGMAAAGEFLRARVEKHCRALYFKLAPMQTRIALATLGNDAGLIGAAALAHQAKVKGRLS